MVPGDPASALDTSRRPVPVGSDDSPLSAPIAISMKKTPGYGKYFVADGSAVTVHRDGCNRMESRRVRFGEGSPLPLHHLQTHHAEARKPGEPLFFGLVLMLAAILLWPVTAPAAEPSPTGGFARAYYVLPPDMRKDGIVFAGVQIPLEKPEVSARVVDQLNYLLMDQRAGMLEWFDRMALYGPMIRKVLEDEKVPADLIYVAVLMSRFLPNARSKTGGVGWWALGAPRGKQNSSMSSWVLTNDWDDRRDPVLATRIASTILQGILRRKQKTDWLLAIAAFIDGQEKIDAIVEKAPGFSYWDLVMPPDSDVLIPRLVALKLIDTHREFYAVDLPALPPLAYDFLDRLKFSKDVPLHVVAKWCATSPRSMWELNPGVDPSTGTLPKADARSPSGFPLRVPQGMGPKIMKLLVSEGYLAK